MRERVSEKNRVSKGERVREMMCDSVINKESK